jgi:3-oxoacyl-[acyl-carrier-protein] synthase-3
VVDKRERPTTLLAPVRFEKVEIASVAHVLPSETVASEAIEARLAPIYERFGLHAGRLELMSGIKTRRFFPRGTRPSAAAAEAGELALSRTHVARERIGMLIHASVCRDFLEPATASVVHDRLGLAGGCLAFDLSNACLGFANAMVVAANAIEAGQIEAALVVAAEDGRALVDETVERLASDTNPTKAGLKAAFASLTIGGGAAAAVLSRSGVAGDASRLVAATSRTASEHHVLCQGDHSGAGMWMATDSEGLLVAGNALAAETFAAFLADARWQRGEIERVVTHQVGVAHRRLVLETLALDPRIDFPTVEELGNIGSVSLPLTLSLARERGFVAKGQRTALLGIASGLQCQMLAVVV